MKKKVTAGFTIIELLIVLLIGIIVSIAVLRTIFSFIRTQRTLRSISDLTIASETIMNELTHDIHWATELDVSLLPDEVVVLVDSQLVEYYLDTAIEPASIVKNGVSLNPKTVKVVDFQVVNLADSDTLPLLEVTLVLESNTTLGSRSIKETKTIVSMRNKQSI